jgi:hypothetical protein
VRAYNAAPGEQLVGDLQGGAINSGNTADIITRVCHTCGILSRTPICANCIHTYSKYSTLIAVDEGAP